MGSVAVAVVVVVAVAIGAAGLAWSVRSRPCLRLFCYPSNLRLPFPLPLLLLGLRWVLRPLLLLLLAPVPLEQRRPRAAQ